MGFIQIISIILLILSTSIHATVLHFRSPYHPIGSSTNLPMIDLSLMNNNISQSIAAHCSERWRESRIDHFAWSNTQTFKQRYFICDKDYVQGGPVFFYLGNEADVTLYLNNTGLMHQLAPKFNALLVFAEHRYYGMSKPYPAHELRHNMGYLTTEQAMADYADLIWDLRVHDLQDETVPVIGFGGSYGGMLATWFRIKYPHLMDGAIAASAPIWTFYGEHPEADPGGFAEVVTWDASEEGGSAPECVENARKTWATLFEWGKTKEGRQRIARSMSFCTSDLPDIEAVYSIADASQSAWSYLAMGDYPYPSSYILNGQANLPAYPVRAACEYLADASLFGERLLSAMAQAVGVFFNATGSLECFDFGLESASNVTEEDATFWDYQYCTEQFMPQTTDGIRDMFYRNPRKPNDTEPRIDKEESKRCRKTWNVTPLKFKASIEWGGRHVAQMTSNIVFSNGGRDPWRSGGVLQSLSDSLVAVNIPEGAHHLDLMFSNELDPPSVIEARRIEEHHIRKWIEQARRRLNKQSTHDDYDNYMKAASVA